MPSSKKIIGAPTCVAQCAGRFERSRSPQCRMGSGELCERTSTNQRRRQASRGRRRQKVRARTASWRPAAAAARPRGGRSGGAHGTCAGNFRFLASRGRGPHPFDRIESIEFDRFEFGWFELGVRCHRCEQRTFTVGGRTGVLCGCERGAFARARPNGPNSKSNDSNSKSND